jgi:hypothetical protein
MNTSKEYYQPVLEALCAYIRDRAAETSSEEVLPSGNFRVVASDIQAALNVIGRRVLLGEAVPDLEGVRFPKANLIDAHLSRAYLGRANLSGANLFGADLSRAYLNEADLIGARLNEADLSGAILIGADLTGANLTGANLTGANLTGANLSGANLTKADLTGARNLTQQQLDQACGNTHTKLDPGLTIKPCTLPPPPPR